MTRRLLRTLAAALALAVAGPTPLYAASVRGVDAEIARLERDWNGAYGANDLPKYFAAYADDAVLIFDGERSSLADYRKSWSAAVASGNRLESVQLSDLVVRVAPSGDTAIASYRLEVRTLHPAGQATDDEHFFETDVWQRRGGAWKVVHVHYSAVPSK
jgi:ketosteroid isomerase-like protein